VTLPLRVGLIGAGRWAAAHRNTLPVAGASLEAVLTSSLESAARMQREWQVPAYHDLEEFLALGLEAVIIASPNDLHASQALRALASGHHVLIEKPLALTLADADAVVAAAAESDRVVAVGHEMRAFDLFVRIQQLLRSGRLGEPLQLSINLWRRPYRAGAGGWKRDPARLGSTVLEEPIHYLDLARWLMGEPSEVLAWSSSRDPEAPAHDNLDVRLRFAGSGAAPRWGLISRSIAAAGHRVEVQLVGREASLRGHWHGDHDSDLAPRVELVLHGPLGDEPQAVSRASGHAYDLVRQTLAFVNAIRTGTPVIATAADGRTAVALSLAVEASLRLGGPVALSDAN
jgi:myo-inositol 2-dehydrogenase/D-chiro-inositol 1-dehydrogenase